jgi:hypothetical protein
MSFLWGFVAGDIIGSAIERAGPPPRRWYPNNATQPPPGCTTTQPTGRGFAGGTAISGVTSARRRRNSGTATEPGERHPIRHTRMCRAASNLDLMRRAFSADRAHVPQSLPRLRQRSVGMPAGVSF